MITKPCLVIYRQLFFALNLSSRGFGSRQILKNLVIKCEEIIEHPEITSCGEDGVDC